VSNPDQRPLAGRTAIVTGGGSGIGESITRRLHRDGARVVIVDVAQAPAQALCRELGDQEVALVVGDVTQVATAREAVATAVERFGSLGILVNNAGWVKTDVITNASEEDFDRTIATYLKGYWLFCREALGHWRRLDQGGVIVNLSSMQAYRAIPGRSAVQMAKGTIGALTRQLALDYGPAGVRVNAVLPGLVLTEKAKASYAESATPEELDLRRQCYPLRRLGTPSDISAAVAFLVSDEASWITGIDLLVDGGITVENPEAFVFPPFRRLWQEASPQA
jgi:NAD(P)-dependent dehydrogenase (short-subunit alcohol dehydrogenase family)